MVRGRASAILVRDGTKPATTMKNGAAASLPSRHSIRGSGDQNS